MENLVLRWALVALYAWFALASADMALLEAKQAGPKLRSASLVGAKPSCSVTASAALVY